MSSGLAVRLLVTFHGRRVSCPYKPSVVRTLRWDLMVARSWEALAASGLDTRLFHARLTFWKNCITLLPLAPLQWSP